MKYLPNSSFIRAAIAGLAIASFAGMANATPFASCVTNSGTGGTNVSFYLNEGGANVTVTYEDGTTNTGFNGVTTGTNLAAGVTNFSLAGHTSYSIIVAKNGTGAPSRISTHSVSNTRGVTANTIPTSPAFGRVYDVQANVGVFLLNSDLSLAKATAQTGGIGFPFGNASTTTASPDWVSIAPDGSVMVTDESLANSAVYQMTPDFSSAQMVLGPPGTTNIAAHSVIISPALFTGSIANGNARLVTVDGNFGDGSIQVYDIGSGPLPWTNAPNYQGPQIAIPGFTESQLGGNEYIGLTQGPNGYIYASTSRNSPGSANYLTITDSSGSNVVWDSENMFSPTNYGTPPTGDWFFQTATSGALTSGPIGISGSAVSPDGLYVVGMAIESYFVVAPLTNGIPNTAAIFTILPTGVSGSGEENGRGVSWDAADNIIMSSSGLGTVSTYSLGFTATATTTGNATGTTGFSLVSPSTSVSVVATTPNASQGGVNGVVGTPVPGVFTISRFSTNGYGSAQTVNYVLSGTATAGTNGAFTVLSTNSVTIPAGQTNVTVTINPTTNNVPRATTTVTLSVTGGAGYTVAPPVSDTVTIQNTSSQQIALAASAPSMYRAFSNDFASFTVSRLGDTNAAAYTVPASSYTYSGTAIAGTDFTFPSNITFNPGDLVYTNQIFPLVNGQPPVDTNNPTYVGNLTAVIGLASGSGYTATSATASLTSIDNADQPTTVLWHDDLTDTNDAANWIVTFGSGNLLNDGTNGEYEVDFGYDLTANNPNYGFNGTGNGVIGLPPSGATNCLRITCNKASESVGSEGGVNIFPILSTNFSGNYAVRFYMNIVQGSDSGDGTEGPLFGINHLSKGVTTNWFAGTTITSELPGLTSWACDGVWYWVDGQAGGEANGDYVEFTGITTNFPNSGFTLVAGAFGSTFANNFKYPVPFSTFPAYGPTGIPANESPNATENVNSTPANTWADVEIKQINNLVTMSIDKTVIFTYTNTLGWTKGVPMLGYEDPFPSIQTEDGAAYFSDIRVVSIGNPAITHIALVKAGSTTNVVINFTTTDGDDTAASFNLLSSSTVTTIDTATTATFTQLGSGAFQAVTTEPTNSSRFYRIQHK